MPHFYPGGWTSVYFGSRGREDYFTGIVKGCFKISVNHCSLHRSRLCKLLGRGKESVNVTIDRKRWGKNNRKAQEKDGRTSYIEKRWKNRTFITRRVFNFIIMMSISNLYIKCFSFEYASFAYFFSVLHFLIYFVINIVKIYILLNKPTQWRGPISFLILDIHVFLIVSLEFKKMISSV